MGTIENDYCAYKKLQEIFSGSKGITITVGERGYIVEENNQVINYPAFKIDRPVIDTNAAGDIFHGAFTYAMASKYSYYDSLKFANITAALSTTRVGGRKSIPNLDEVYLNMDKDNLNKNKVKVLTK